MAFANGPKIVTDGLVLSLDAADRNSYPGSGTAWNDLAGSNNGTLTNGPTFNSSNGGSIVFDGVDDYVNLGNILNLGTNSCTINVWLNINSSWDSGTKYFVSKALANSQNYRYAFGFTQTRQLRGFVQGNSGGGSDIVPNTIATLNLNQWYMCTMVINRTSTIDLYINGVLQTVDSTNIISQWSGLDFQSNNPFRVGSYTGSDNISPALVLPGNIALTQMYFRTLSAAEVLQNYNATKGRFGL
jgi:hypothetical protein